MTKHKIDRPTGAVPVTVVTWEAKGRDREMSHTDFSGLALQSIQVSGTFEGESITLLGSNDGVEFHRVADRYGIDIDFRSAGLVAVDAPFRFFKPEVAYVTDDTNLVITGIARGTK